MKIEKLIHLYIARTDHIKNAIQVISQSNAQICLVIDERKKLIGTVTDGDIRRGLLKGLSLESQVGEVMQRQFTSLPIGASVSDVLKVMSEKYIAQVPMLNAAGQVEQLHLMRDLVYVEPLSNYVVIMAGGRGERLRPLTNSCPKPMLLVHSKPILEVILERCVESGFSNFYISVNYLKEHITDYFGDGSRWGVNIEYIQEDKPLGTVGSLSLLPQKPTAPFLVINGDVLTRVNYGDILDYHKQNSAHATICVRQHETTIPYGVVTMSGVKVSHIAEKPLHTEYVNAGVYVFSPDMLDLIASERRCDMPEVILDAIDANLNVVGFPLHEYWIDIGQPDSFQKALSEVNWTD